MDIKILIKIIIGGCVVILCPYLLSIMVLEYSLEEARTASENQLMVMALTKETGNNSYGLTNNARSYLASGEQSYKDAYWDIVHIREGQMPRSNVTAVSPGRQIPLTTLFDEANFTTEEKELLNKAKQLSSELVELEDWAMNLVDTASVWELPTARIKALDLVNNETYRQAILAIHEPISIFESHLIQQQKEYAAAPLQLAQRIQIIHFLLTGLTGILVISLLIWAHRKVSVPLAG